MKQICDILASSIATWILAAINIAVFLTLHSDSGSGILHHFVITGDAYTDFTEPWRLLTYSFVHLSPVHLVSNVFFLILGGMWFQRRGKAVELCAAYLSGAVAGGVLYACTGATSVLTGASAAIFSVITCGVFLHKDILISFGKINLKVRTGAMLAILAIVVLSGVVSINPGGAIAHTGGFIAGLIFSLSKEKSLARTSRNRTIEKAELSGFLSLTYSEKQGLATHNSNPR